MAALYQAKTLLGSATPSIESFYNATKENKFGYVALTKRFNNVLMPEIELEQDMKLPLKTQRFGATKSTGTGQLNPINVSAPPFSPKILCH